jgi:hypothetical protein
LEPEQKDARSKPSSALALIGKLCPNCGVAIEFLDNPPMIFPDDLAQLDWDYIKNLHLVPKVLGICLRCGFVVTESLTPVEASGLYVST